MLKIVLMFLSVFILVNASDYSRANSAAKDAFKDFDCDFGDCPKPQVIIQEKVVVKEVPVVVEKEVIVEKQVVVEKIVYKDREPETIAAPSVVPTVSEKRLYNASFDIPVIGVEGTSFYTKSDQFFIEDDRVKPRKVSSNYYLKSQSIAAWAEMKLKNGKSLFLSKFDETIPYYRESITQVSFHVELPSIAIYNDTTVVALPKKSFKNSSGNAEEYATCRFNGFTPTNSKLQSTIDLNGKNYLDIECTIVLYGYNVQGKVNSEIQNMIQSESFDFIPVYRVFPPTRKGSKKAVLGTTLKKFIFASEIAE